MERIVVGLDAEAPSQVAVDWAIRRAREKPVAIRLVTAFDVLISDPTADQARLAAAAVRIERSVPGVPVTTALVDGSVTEALVGESRSADLLVLGYHRSRPVLSVLRGALPARIAARAYCATVIVPEDWRPKKGRVVLGVGDDDSAETAGEFAAREATHPRRDLEVVHGWMLPSPSLDTLAALVVAADEMHARHREILDGRVRALRESHPALTIRPILTEGSPADALLRRSTHAGLLVIGTHRRSPVRGLLLGSTALDLLPESRVPLCIVPLVSPLTPAGGVLATIPGD